MNSHVTAVVRRVREARATAASFGSFALILGSLAGFGMASYGIIDAAPAAAASCTTFVSGTYLGTWEVNNNALTGAAEIQLEFSGTALTGSLSLVNGTNEVIPGNSITGTVGCTTFSGSVVNPNNGFRVSFTDTESNGVISGTLSDNLGDSGTASAGLVYSQVSAPSTTLLSTGNTTSSSEPIQTTVNSATAGSMSISSALATAQLPGYALFSTFVQISAPPGSPSAPLELTFVLDPSVTNGESSQNVTVFRNGVAVPKCTSTSPISPDPCESSAATLADGGISITVLTSEASIWAFGAPPQTPTALGPITGLPIDPIAVGTSATGSTAFTDAGQTDTHTCSIEWGDGATSAGSVVESNGSGRCSGSHSYAAAGVYGVSFNVDDSDGTSASVQYQYIVVYDPSAGFVTGGGWINSPSGAYVPNPDLSGKATFGFVSRYQKGANVPTGNTEFQFQEAGLDYQSTDYQWLVISGGKAQYKGDGTINGASGYGFLLTACDASVRGNCDGASGDSLRLKIWSTANGQVVYDNAPGPNDLTSDTEAISGGSITIHS